MSMPPQSQYGFCATCGTPRMTPDQGFCPTCGAALAVVAVTPAQGYGAPAPSQPVAPPAYPYQQPAQYQPGDPNQPPPYYGQQPGWPQGQARGGGLGTGPILAIIGGVVVLALILGGIAVVAMSGHGSTSAATPTLLATPSPSATVLVTVAPPTAAPTTGSITFSPSVVTCSTPIVFTMYTTLPATVLPGDSLTQKFDGVDGGKFTVTPSDTMTHNADGTWSDVSPSTLAEMTSDCNNGGKSSNGLEVLTPGTHTIAFYTSDGALLAQGSYTVLASGPVPGSGAITFSPSTISCSAPVEFVTTIILPSSVQSGDAVTETLDGANFGSGTVSTASGWVHESDGSWSSTTTDSTAAVTTSCTSGDSVLSAGIHAVKILDADGNVLAEGQYTAAP
jgi:hypothetical protein